MKPTVPHQPNAARLGLAVVLVALLLLLSSPVVMAGDDAGGGLVIGVGRDFFDGPDSAAYVHGSTNAWEALTYLGPDLLPRPWLASSWQSQENCRVWLFKIRPGVRFHDGSPLTPADVAASVRRIMGRPQYDAAGNYRHVTSVEARGDQVIFTLDRPTPHFASLTAYFASPVLKPDGFDAQGRVTRFVATGPYRLTKVLPGQRLELTAFDDYWGPKPTHRRVVFRHIADAQTRVMALLAGEIDAVADVGAILPEQALELAQNPLVALKRQEVATTHYLIFNCGRPPFADAQARRWLAGLVDRQRLLEALAGDSGLPAQDPYTRLAKEWVFGLVRPQAGHAPPPIPGRPLVIALHAGTLQRWPYLDMAQIIQAQLAQAGWSAEIVIREPGGYYEALRQGQFDLALQPNTLMTGDPDFFYSYYLDAGGSANRGWRNQRAQGLIEAGRRETNHQARLSIYRELEEIFAAELPLLPLYHERSVYALGGQAARLRMDHNFRPLLTAKEPWETK